MKGISGLPRQSDARREMKNSAVAFMGLCEPDDDGPPWTTGTSYHVLSPHSSRAGPSSSCALQGELGVISSTCATSAGRQQGSLLRREHMASRTALESSWG